MTHGPSRTDEDTQELPGTSKRREPTRREHHKGTGESGGFRSPEAIVLLLSLVSLIILLPLRGVLSAAPAIMFLATLTLFLIPGFLICRLMLDDGFSGMARLPIASVLSTGIFGVLALPFLVLNRSLNEYFLASSLLLILALGFTLYRLVTGEPSEATKTIVPPPTLVDLLWLPFAGLAGTLAYVSTVIQEEPNGDSWIYLAYVRDYLSADRLAASNPILGGQTQDSYISFRTTINGWLLEQAALSRASGIMPVDLVLNYLAPVLVVLSLLAVYALALLLFGKGPALLTASLTALFFLVDLQSTIPTAFLSPGNDFVARVTEDKYVARFLFLPVSLGLAVLYLRERKLRYLAFFTFVCWSVAVVHPIGLVLISISVAGLGFFHLVGDFRERSSWRAVLGLGAAVAGISVPPLLYLLATGSPLLSRLSDSDMAESLIQAWVASKRLLVLGEGSYIMHPAFLLNPAVIAAYALGISFVLFRLRRDLAAQLLLGILVFTPLLIYVPPISTMLAKLIGPWVLVRLSWPISLAAPLVIGWGMWRVLDYARPWLERSRVRAVRYVGAALPILVITILVAATAPTSFAAIRTANDTDEIPQDQATCFDPVFRWMQDEITEFTTVLAPPVENSCIPAYSANADVVTLRGISRNNRVELNLSQFYSSYTVDEQDERFLRRQEIGYVLVPASSPLNAQLQHLPGFAALENPGDRYKLYRVDQSALVETTAVTANTLMGNEDLFATDYYIAALSGDRNEQFLAYMGLGVWNMRQNLYTEAAAYYEEALSVDTEQPTLYDPLSYVYDAAGETNLARLALENGVRRFPESIDLRTSLSALLASQDPAAAVEVQQEVVSMFPEVREYRVNLGSYLLTSGDNEAADREFDRAIRRAPLSEQLHTDVGFANQTSGRKQEAIRHYERALQLNPNFQEARELLQALSQ